MLRRIACGALSACLTSAVPAFAANRLAVAWNNNAGGAKVQAMTTSAPFEFVTPALPVGMNSLLRHAHGKLYALSDDGTITVIDADSWSVDHVFSFGAANPPMDIAVIDSTRAYVTRASSTHLERLDLGSGALIPVVDLSAFADADGIPDLGLTALFEGRLFIQLPRKFRCGEATNPPVLAVVDVNSEQLVDADPIAPGVQAIDLDGACPGRKMPVVAQTRTLWVSAGGGYNDVGGYERVNVDTLESMGMFIIEHTDIDSDIGPLIMVAADRGYVVSGTDSTLSSHVRSFTLAGGLDPAEHHTSLGYDLPEMEYDPPTGHLFVPDGQFDSQGIIVFDASTATRLTPTPIAVTGMPTDVELICDGPAYDCAALLEPASIPAASTWGLVGFFLGTSIAGARILRRKECTPFVAS